MPFEMPVVRSATAALRSLRLPAAVVGCLLLSASTSMAFGVPSLLKDISPGAPASTPQVFIPIGDKLVFFANNGTTGIEPWVSDGTLLGTFLLRDVRPGAAGGFNPGCTECNATAANGIAYFSASDGTGGSQLWRTDGTTAGTYKVFAGSNATDITRIGTKIYFTGSFSELFVSDGTGPGTAPIAPGTYLAGHDMTDVNGIAYFPASDCCTGVELWKSDGTTGGTVRVKDIWPGSSGSYISSITNVGGTVYFSASNGTSAGLFKSDGTSAGTVLVKALSITTGDAEHRQIIGVGGTVYMIASDPAHGAELWKSDGTTLGTVLVKDIYPGVGPGIPSGVAGSGLVAVGNTVYFKAGDATRGFELWKSDGTELGTDVVRDIFPLGSSSSPAGLANVGGTLFFRAMSSFAAGTQPWTSDGTEAGTVELASIYPANNSAATSFKAAGSNIFFSATEGTNGIELWSMANPVLDVDPAPAPLSGLLALGQNDPNPALNQTRIAYTLPAAGRVVLRLFDAHGRAVRTLVDEDQAAGRYRVELDARALASGVYFFKLEAGSVVRQRKMVLQR